MVDVGLSGEIDCSTSLHDEEKNKRHECGEEEFAEDGHGGNVFILERFFHVFQS